MSTETAATTLDPRNVRQALSDVRWAYMDRFVSDLIDRRDGDVSHEQIEAWQQEYVDRWNARHPELIELWKAIDEGRVTIAERAQSGETP